MLILLNKLGVLTIDTIKCYTYRNGAFNNLEGGNAQAHPGPPARVKAGYATESEDICGFFLHVSFYP